MSSFENYDQTSRHYDATRVAVGSEIILGCLARLGRPLANLRLLDAGCGTGAYTQAVIGQVGKVEAIDMSQGMLAAARGKLRLEAKAGRVAFHRGSITALPFADGVFDAAMINQVLHHLGDSAANDFAGHRAVMAEIARVLRPGGGLIVNTCTAAQLRDAYWYRALIPEATERVSARYAPPETLTAMLSDVGLEPCGSFVPLDALCQGPAYLDGRGPLDKAWRDGDSVWALASEAELARALDQVRALDANGELDAFVAEHDTRRAEIGQIVFLFARRSS